MKKTFTRFRSIFVLILLLTTCSLHSLAEWANDEDWFYINVCSSDPSKGLVYADTIANAQDPVYVPTIDLKWVNIWAFLDEPDIVFYPYGYANPSNGWVFTSWGKNDSSGLTVISVDNPALLSLETNSYNSSFPEEPDDVYYAFFGKIAVQVDPLCKKYNLGTVVMSNYQSSTGDQVTLTAIPVADNISFSKWVLNGEVVSSDNVITVTASDTPQTYYAYFEAQNICEYNFDDNGEWKVYYHPSMNAHLPSNAVEAHMIPNWGFDGREGTYYTLKSKILKPNTPYLIYGCGKGLIEYFNFEPGEENEFSSAVQYASQDIEVECYFKGEYCLYNPQTGKFDQLEKGNHILPKGCAYIDLTYLWNASYDEFDYLGELERSIDLSIDSYYCKDFENGGEGYNQEPSSIKMEFVGGSTLNYKITQLFNYSPEDLYAEIIPNTNDEFTIRVLNQISFFNYIINYDNGSPIDVHNWSGLIWTKVIKDGEPNYDRVDYDAEDYDIRTTNDPRVLKILKDPETGNYTMDDFYIGHVKIERLSPDEEEKREFKILKHFSQINLHKNDAAGIENIVDNDSNIEYRLEGNDIVLSQLTNVQIYSLNGTLVRNCKTDRISDLQKGFYIVRVADKAFKVAIR